MSECDDLIVDKGESCQYESEWPDSYVPRFYGRVKSCYYRQGWGHIEELGQVDVGSHSELIVKDHDVFFHVSKLSLPSNPKYPIIPKLTNGEIVEYTRKTDEKGRHEAHDIRGIHGTPLQCEEGLLIFKRYSDLNREMLRREGSAAVSDYVSTRNRYRGHKRNRRRSRSSER